ncbi:hypothetical protein CS0771_07430 [Catellatospora sp. IY07-71]|uniref:hypothetical protein n=1 Tax=Catellatospora sp. IY07-71 TaxID=2728827 RepID=UPI001BB363B6|nr:hypothetical protein [Catellatospora sp. IY07-71]BCJ71199.1 hypothetical protein CS0771_07430 [Catellatospora sp. IY07-71]
MSRQPDDRYFGHDPRDLEELWERLGGAGRPDDEVDLVEALDVNHYETLREYHPDGRMVRYLSLRLFGERVKPGELDTYVTKEIFSGFDSEVAGAAKALRMRTVPTFALSHITAGSAVLHLKPSMPEVTDPDGLEVTVDPVDGLIELLTRLHDAAENEEDLREFSDHEQMLRALRELVSVLERHNLSLDMRWRTGDGRHRRSQLTSRARRHVRQLWDSDRLRTERTITGRVVEISLNSFTIKEGHKRKLEIHVEGEEAVLGLNLPLGNTVSVRVDEIDAVNLLGIRMQKRLVFVGYAGTHDQLF